MGPIFEDKENQILMLQALYEKKRISEEKRLRECSFPTFMDEIYRIVINSLAFQQLGCITTQDTEDFQRRAFDLYDKDLIFYHKVRMIVAQLYQVIQARYER